MLNRIKTLVIAFAITASVGSAFAADRLKLGYLVKQPDEPWFQTEWVYAEKAGKDLGFDVIKIGVPNAEKTMAAIEKLAAAGAKGFVICAPDPKLGSAIITGPYVESFQDLFDTLFAAGGAVRAHDATTLAAEIARLWRDDTSRGRQLEAARAVTAQGSDAFEHTLDAVQALVPLTQQSPANASA